MEQNVEGTPRTTGHMDWVVDETQLALMEDADRETIEMAGYVTWCVDTYDGNLMKYRRPTDGQAFGALEELGLVRGNRAECEAHPNLLNAFRYVILSENIREIDVINRDDAWDAMVEGIRLGTFN